MLEHKGVLLTICLRYEQITRSFLWRSKMTNLCFTIESGIYIIELLELRQRHQNVVLTLELEDTTPVTSHIPCPKAQPNIFDSHICMRIAA